MNEHLFSSTGRSEQPIPGHSRSCSSLAVLKSTSMHDDWHLHRAVFAIRAAAVVPGQPSSRRCFSREQAPDRRGERAWWPACMSSIRSRPRVAQVRYVVGSPRHGHSWRSQRRRQTESVRVQRWHLAGHEGGEPRHSPGLQPIMATNTGCAGLASPHRVHSRFSIPDTMPVSLPVG
jgi:hypothetical protein